MPRVLERKTGSKVGRTSMEIILNRKGFDSGYGGIASPILPDGMLLLWLKNKRNHCFWM